MDNRVIDVVSEGEEGIKMAMRLIWPSALGGEATHYILGRFSARTRYYGEKGGNPIHHVTSLEKSEKGSHTLILLWHEERESIQLPFPLDLDGATQFVSQWLKSADYGREPDHDGDNGKGWRIFTEDWGHVAGHHYAIVGVQPAWAMYGK